MTDVTIGCPCPGAPHTEDTVSLREKLGLQAGIAVQTLLIEQLRAQDNASEAEVTGILTEAYLLYGVESWSLVDGEGKPVPVNKDTIRERLLNDFEVAAPIADKADDLYLGPVLLPLLRKLGLSLPTTPTSESTSATPKSPTPKARKSSRSTRPSRVIQMPQKPSSTSTTQTASIGVTSVALAGGSSS